MDEDAPQLGLAGAAIAAVNQSPHYWTWRVMAAGFSAGECQSVRGLSRQQVIEHLLHAVGDGLAVDPQWVLTPDQRKALDGEFANGKPRDFASLAGRLPAGITRPEAELYLLARIKHQPRA